MTIIHKTFAANSILTSADLNKYLMNQAVVGVDTVAELDTLPTTVKVAFCTATQLVYQRSSSNAWGVVVRSPRPITGTFNPNGSSSAAQINMANLTIPDPGFPYMIMTKSWSESGSTAAGTRFDSQVWALNGGVDTILSYAIRAENVGWNQESSGGPVLKGSSAVPFTGSTTVRYILQRVYGPANGAFTAFNQLFRVWIHPA